MTEKEIIKGLECCTRKPKCDECPYMDMQRYNIYYQKYNIIANDYMKYIKVVETDDIYHEVGKIICKSIEKIKSISYTRPIANKENCEKYFEEEGYRKLNNDTWIMAKPSDKERNCNGCKFCKTPIYQKTVQYTMPMLAPMTRAEELRHELQNLTGEVYLEIDAEYCPLCGARLKEF